MTNECYPTHYSITIESNFEDFTFNGTTKIFLNSKTKIQSVVLNASDLTISSCQLHENSNKSLIQVTNNYSEEELIINLGKELIGEFILEFVYEGKINDSLKGLYKTRYKVGSEKHIGAVTHFETEDARRMFPCFDEPGLKATFELVVITDEKFTVISNTPVKTEKKLQMNKKQISFEKTPKMSTYLLFLGIAEFESINKMLNKINVQVLAHPGLVQYGNLALDFGVKTLDYCQKYFSIPYPLPKMDLLSTPDFAAGAMENWGAILFRESALLKFPTTSKIQENRIIGVVAHEIVHQWFGNLVSPSLWKYIWLNESFATFLGTKIVDYYHPELYPLDNALIFRGRNMALTADAYHETVPIEIAEQKRTSFNSKTTPIIYGKGGAILRMIENYIGKEAFQKGLQLYLKKHQFDVASSDDLWTALEESSKKPVVKIMESWVLQSGMPLVTVSRKGKTSLSFKQERFTYLFNDYPTIWPIPISLILFKPNKEQLRMSYLLEKKEAVFDTGIEFTTFKLNADNTGFYRVNYPAENYKNLITIIKNGEISTLDSWNLVNDFYDMLCSGRTSLQDYLEFIASFKSEKLFSAITAISNQLVDLYRLSEEKNKDLLSSNGILFHEVLLNKIGYSEPKNEDFKNTIIRNTLLLNACYLGSKKSIASCMEEFKKIKEGKIVSANILDAVLSVAANQTNDLVWFVEKFTAARDETDILLFGNALGEFTSDETIDKVLEEILFQRVSLRNQATTIDRLCNNPHAIDKMWTFYLANLDHFGKMPPGIQGRAINSIVSNTVNEEAKDDIEKFFKEYGKNNIISKITSEKALETLKINLSIKNYLKK